MAAAVDNRRQAHARPLGPHVQRAHALGSVKLVPRHREQVDTVAFDVDRNLAYRLHRVAVKDDPAFLGDAPDLADRMNRPDLVVGVHDRDQHGLVGDRVAHRVGIDHPVLVHRQVGHGRLARPFQRAATVEHRLVLGDAGDDVVALVLVELDNPLDRLVVGLGRAAGENYLLGLRIDQRGDLVARLVDRFLGFPAEAMVAAGGVAELLREVRQHRLQHPRIDRRRRVIVHVYRQLDHRIPNPSARA